MEYVAMSRNRFEEIRDSLSSEIKPIIVDGDYISLPHTLAERLVPTDKELAYRMYRELFGEKYKTTYRLQSPPVQTLNDIIPMLPDKADISKTEFAYMQKIFEKYEIDDAQNASFEKIEEIIKREGLDNYSIRHITEGNNNWVLQTNISLHPDESSHDYIEIMKIGDCFVATYPQFVSADRTKRFSNVVDDPTIENLKKIGFNVILTDSQKFMSALRDQLHPLALEYTYKVNPEIFGNFYNPGTPYNSSSKEMFEAAYAEAIYAASLDVRFAQKIKESIERISNHEELNPILEACDKTISENRQIRLPGGYDISPLEAQSSSFSKDFVEDVSDKESAEYLLGVIRHTVLDYSLTDENGFEATASDVPFSDLVEAIKSEQNQKYIDTGVCTPTIITPNLFQGPHSVYPEITNLDRLYRHSVGTAFLAESKIVGVNKDSEVIAIDGFNISCFVDIASESLSQDISKYEKAFKTIQAELQQPTATLIKSNYGNTINLSFTVSVDGKEKNEVMDAIRAGLYSVGLSGSNIKEYSASKSSMYKMFFAKDEKLEHIPENMAQDTYEKVQRQNFVNIVEKACEKAEAKTYGCIGSEIEQTILSKEEIQAYQDVKNVIKESHSQEVNKATLENNR